MNSADKQLIDGPAGQIEIALDWPEGTAAGIVFIGHPHPLYGGTMDNKVVTTIGRAFNAAGWLAVRPNFRGVGESTGEHAEGEGESDDLLHVVNQVRQLNGVGDRVAADAPCALGGFSFGSFVAARVARSLAAARRPVKHLVLVGVAAGKWPMPTVRDDTLVIHGEYDETIPLADVMEWARPQELPVVVVPGADHFFHRRLTLLKRLISVHLQGASAGSDI